MDPNTTTKNDKPPYQHTGKGPCKTDKGYPTNRRRKETEQATRKEKTGGEEVKETREKEIRMEDAQSRKQPGLDQERLTANQERKRENTKKGYRKENRSGENKRTNKSTNKRNDRERERNKSL